jgi:beta-galactosidase
MKNRRLMKRRNFLQNSAALLGAGPLLEAGVHALDAAPEGEAAGGRERVTLRLDGEWEIADSVDADETPAEFTHTVPVPGLAHLAKPPFPDVDKFETRENLWDRVSAGELPKSAWTSLPAGARGISGQKRNYFWYRKTFRAPARRQVAILKVSKAQFGTAVWVNGKKLGEHLGCFTAGYFNVTDAIDWQAENEVVIRVGAHPGVLPAGAPAGTDFEKRQWTPGIYDRVFLNLSDNPVIESVQVAPRIAASEILVQAKLRNHAAAPSEFDLNFRVRTWKERRSVAQGSLSGLKLGPGESRTITHTIAVPNAHLWSPESPFLYTLETRTGGDSEVSRFGMREIRFDTTTKRALLNGKVYFWRGSNITLHRFFEDPESGSLPWDEKWLRKLLIEIPKQMNWNSFRFCIGPVPEQWLDLADEAGLLIQNEFFVWTGSPSWSGEYKAPEWNVEEMIRQYGEWMRDNWNHPSVAIWDATNETLDDVFASRIIPAVRQLDLSGRAWENSYNGPQGPDDPVEDHPYQFIKLWYAPGESFKMTDLEDSPGLTPGGDRPATGHAMILNEYGWLWLNRDGSPTRLTEKVYAKLLGPGASAEERLALNAYLLAGLTEFWRAFRQYAGVLHFVYLTSSYPEAYTSDNFRDVRALELDPHFKDYVAEAFKPFGLYINFWQPSLEAGSKRRFFVMAVNDHDSEVSGNLVLSLETEAGQTAARRAAPFQLPALGQQTFYFDMELPASPGKYLLRAAAYSSGNSSPTLSRRKLSLTARKG